MSIMMRDNKERALCPRVFWAGGRRGVRYHAGPCFRFGAARKPRPARRHRRDATGACRGVFGLVRDERCGTREATEAVEFYSFYRASIASRVPYLSSRTTGVLGRVSRVPWAGGRPAAVDDDGQQLISVMMRDNNTDKDESPRVPWAGGRPAAVDDDRQQLISMMMRDNSERARLARAFHGQEDAMMFDTMWADPQLSMMIDKN